MRKISYIVIGVSILILLWFLGTRGYIFYIWGSKKLFLPSFGFSNKEILEMMDSDYKYPKDFYQEDLQRHPLYYGNTISITPLNKRENKWMILCADDKERAFQWSELTNKKSSYQRSRNEENDRETEKYFQFGWGGLLHRIDKCGYLDRSEFNRLEDKVNIGEFNKRPLTNTSVKELCEYLWFIENYEIGTKVLKSSTKEEKDSFKHVIYEIKHKGGDWKMPAGVVVNKLEYVVNKSSGKIVLSKEEVKTIYKKLTL